MKRIVVKNFEITDTHIKKCFSLLLIKFNNKELDLLVPRSSELVSKGYTHRSFISEIFSFHELLYNGKLNEMGFSQPVSLLDLVYDKKNRHGFDHLFLDAKTGELIIGEVKTAMSKDSKTNYNNSIDRAKNSLKDNKKVSVRKKDLFNFARDIQENTLKLSRMAKSNFSDLTNLELSEEATKNFRDAIGLVLEAMNEDSKELDLTKYQNISLVITSWIGTLEDNKFLQNNYIDNNFNTKVLLNFYDESYNFICSSKITNEIDYQKLYDMFTVDFESNFRKWLDSFTNY